MPRIRQRMHEIE